MHEQSYIAHVMAYTTRVGKYADDNCDAFGDLRSSSSSIRQLGFSYLILATAAAMVALLH